MVATGQWPTPGVPKRDFDGGQKPSRWLWWGFWSSCSFRGQREEESKGVLNWKENVGGGNVRWGRNQSLQLVPECSAFILCFGKSGRASKTLQLPTWGLLNTRLGGRLFPDGFKGLFRTGQECSFTALFKTWLKLSFPGICLGLKKFESFLLGQPCCLLPPLFKKEKKSYQDN